ENVVEQGRVRAVPVWDEVLRPASRVLEVHHQVAGGLVTQSAVGCAVAARMRTRRLTCSMTARMDILAPASVTVSRKSAASNAPACERRNYAQVVPARSGAGSIPASRRISHTVDAATFTPRVSSSPCTLR